MAENLNPQGAIALQLLGEATLLGADNTLGVTMHTGGADRAIPGPRILCEVETHSLREAQIVQTFAEVIGFIEGYWTGVDQFRAPDYGDERDAVATRPDHWEGGRGHLQLDWDDGLVAFTLLGDIGDWHDDWHWVD